MPGSPWTRIPIVIGVDIGTGGARALAVSMTDDDRLSGVLGSSSKEYPTSSPHPGWSEQDPDAWWNAACSALREAINEMENRISNFSMHLDADVYPKIVAVGFSGQMHGLVLRDASGKVLNPAIIWNDQRTELQRDSIHERIDIARFIELTGKPVLTGFTAPKLAWLQDHVPNLAGHVASISLPKDHMVFRATGMHTTDVSDASGTSWLDIQTRDWSPEICEALGVDPTWLPEVHESSEIVGTITAEAAALTGLPEGIPVVAGAGDQAASGLACGVTKPGLVSVTIGTSGVVFAHADSPPRDPTGSLHGFCHAIEGKWHWMGCMLSAGGSLEWYRNTFAPDSSYEQLIEEAMKAPPGSEGLCFLPYLTGERCPHDDPRARGAFIGLTTRHSQAHMTRSVLEGISFGLADILQLIRDTGQSVRIVRVAGGPVRGSNVSAWMQMLADVFKTDVQVVKEPDSTAYGAALLAMVGCGLSPDAHTVTDAMLEIAYGMIPSGVDYAPFQEQWRTLYQELAPAMHRLSDQSMTC